MIYVILGRREQGKTTLAAYLSQKTNCRCRVVFDPRGLFPARERATTYVEIDRQFGRIEEGATGSVIVTPEYELQDRFDQTCREVKHLVQNQSMSVTLILDEARMIDIRSGPCDWLLRCASRATVTIILTAHRPKDVPVDARAIADVWCVFPTTQAHDYEVFEDQFNDGAVSAIRRLKDRQFVAWDDTSASYKVHDDPSLWYVPLAASTGERPRIVLEGGRSEEKKDLLSDM